MKTSPRLLSSLRFRAVCLWVGLVTVVSGGAGEIPVLPRDWKLRPVTEHPFLLFSLGEVPAIKARLFAEFGAIDKIGDRALVVYLTGGEAARRKATADFIAYWKNYALRWTEANLGRESPDGVSMRGIRRCLLLYDLVASYGYLTAEETKEFRATLVRSIEFALGSDAAHPRINPKDGSRRMNIWTDVVTAAAMVGLAFPDLPQARGWIEFAVSEINWQLERGVWDGCWHESPRYHTAMITITGLFFHVLERRTGVNQFSHPQFKALLDWLVRFQTPLDKVAGGTIGHPEGVALLPGIGDASWTNISFGVAGMFAPHYAQSDPRFAARLMWVWQRAGRPYGGDSVEWAQVLIDPQLRAEPQTLGSDSSPGKGYVVMRSRVDTPDEIWFLLRCGNATRSGHDNADWNAFNLYAFGAPLALDSASGAYSDPRHKAWHDKAVAHNTVVFGGRSQQRLDGKILTWVTRPEVDYSASDASVPAGVERFVRHVVLVKPDYFVMWDEIKSDEPARWMLHTPATKFEWAEHGVRCITPWSAELDVQVVWPTAPLVAGTQPGKYSDWAEKQPQRDQHPFQFQDYFGIPNAPGRDFLVVLHPRKPGSPALGVRDVGEAGRPALEITLGARTDRIALRPDGADVRVGNREVVRLGRGAGR